MKAFITSLIIVLTPLAAISQSKIAGTVVDLRDNLPVKDAAVRLFADGDSTLLTGTATGEDGRFLLADVRAGTFRLEINYMGYSTYTKEGLKVSGEDETINLDTIQLGIKTFRTDEIEVKDEKPLMEFSDDKKILQCQPDDDWEGRDSPRPAEENSPAGRGC